MSRETKAFSDPLIDEVRERRRQLLERFDRDLQKLFEEVQRLQDEHPENLIDPRRSKHGDRP